MKTMQTITAKIPKAAAFATGMLVAGALTFGVAAPASAGALHDYGGHKKYAKHHDHKNDCKHTYKPVSYNHKKYDKKDKKYGYDHDYGKNSKKDKHDKYNKYNDYRKDDHRKDDKKDDKKDDRKYGYKDDHKDSYARSYSHDW